MTCRSTFVAPTVMALAGALACTAPPSRTWPGPRPMRIEDPSQRAQFRGFSLLPPNGPGWMAAPPLPTAPGPVYLVQAFGKEPDRRSANVHTVAASILTWDVGSRTFESPRAFLEYEEAETQSAIGFQVSARHQVLDAKTMLDDLLGPKCVKYDYTVEDTGVPSAPGSPF